VVVVFAVCLSPIPWLAITAVDQGRGWSEYVGVVVIVVHRWLVQNSCFVRSMQWQPAK